MQEFLTLSQEDQKLAIEQTAAHKGRAASSVEKDFWVCWTFRHLRSMRCSRLSVSSKAV